MRGLAEFIMRGRWQALAVATVGAGSLLFGWVSAAAVALVTLRRGAEAGGWVVLWALLPAFLFAWYLGDPGSVLLLLGTFGLACVLRATVSLAIAIAASVFVGLLSGASLMLFSGEFLASMVEAFGLFFDQFEANLAQGGETAIALVPPTALQVAGMFAAANAGMSVLSVLLARYWQAALYNPGGFREEFHALRMPVAGAGLLVVAAAALWSMGTEWAAWAAAFVVPLVFCGFGLVHAWVRATGRGGNTLALFYVIWLLVDPMKWALVTAAVVDAVWDLRSRWQRTGT